MGGEPFLPNLPGGRRLQGDDVGCGRSAHWNWKVDGQGSGMEIREWVGASPAVLGGNCVSFANDLCLNTDTGGVWSHTDLYLMGYDSPAEMDAGNSELRYMNTSCASPYNGTISTFGSADIIASAGPRSPSSATAQKHFTTAWVMIHQPGAPPTTGQLDKAVAILTQQTTDWNFGTLGRGTLCNVLQFGPPPKFSQLPDNTGEDTESDIDWTDMSPNTVVADDFVSDGRPITSVRWWGSNIPPPPPDPKVCDTPFTCGGPLMPCGTPQPGPLQCFCDKRPDGTGVCAQNWFCGTYGACPNGDIDCPSGTKCIIDNCCGQPECTNNCPPPPTGLLYASDPTPANNLGTVDPSTGTFTIIGPFSGAPGRVTEIEWSPDGSTLYGTTGGGSSSIVTINPATGAVLTSVGHPFGALNGLEFDSGGTLLGTFIGGGGGGAPSDLVIVDPLTGVLTVIGPTGIANIGGLAFDATFTTLYGISSGGVAAVPPTLYSVSPITGAATAIASVAMTSEASSLEFTATGVLITAGADGNLYEIDPGSGVATLIGPLVNAPKLSGLSLDPVAPLSAAQTPPPRGSGLTGSGGMTERTTKSSPRAVPRGQYPPNSTSPSWGRTVESTKKRVGTPTGDYGAARPESEPVAVTYPPPPEQATIAGAGCIVVNGDFETGTLAGWTVTDSTGSGTWTINNGAFIPASGDGPLPPCAGSFSAITDMGGPGIRTLYQDVAIPAAASATLRWIDMIRNHNGSFADPAQEFRVEVRNPSDNSVLATLFSTNPGDPAFQPCTARCADISAFAGQTVRIAFAEEDNLFFFNVHLDNVCITLNDSCPTGACCLVGPNCLQNQTASACASQGGIYQGDGSTVCINCPADPCNVTCDPGKTPENEPDCGLPSDTVNGGCNSTPPVFTPIACGDTFCGTGAFDGATRDTDWYKLVLGVPTTVTWTVTAEFQAVVGIVETGGVDACPVAAFRVATILQPCTTGSVSDVLPAGTWYLFVAPDFTVLETCGAEYNAALTCGPPPVCGNGLVEPGEECDPPDGVSCDGSCQWVCGDGIVQSGEECDPPDGVTCDSNCQLISITCGPGAGDCCVAHPNPGCQDVACCNAVCAADPFCCDVEWDQACADEALNIFCGPDGCKPAVCGDGIVGIGEQCDPPGSPSCPGGQICLADCTCPPTGVCGPGQGDCCVAHANPGCQDVSCCQAVCAADPFCCDVEWDQICADEALQICGTGGCGSAICGDNVVNQPSEQCDGTDDAACPGLCRIDCTCAPPPGGPPIDGWLVSFHEPLTLGGPPSPPLALYFCDAAIVTVASTSLGACDAHPVRQYDANLADCCLVHSFPDSRNGADPVTPGEKNAFLETACFAYDIDIQAVVGHKYVPKPSPIATGGNCVEVVTGNTATSPFWGWHTTSVERGLRPALQSVVSMSGPDWLYGPWSPLTPTCSAPNMAFQLLTDVSGGGDCNNNGLPDVCESAPDCQPNDVLDECDLANGTSKDCNGNAVPDECDILTDGDCNANGVPDECDAESVGSLTSAPSAVLGFVDISGTGTPLNLADDAASDVTMPFTTAALGGPTVSVANNGGVGLVPGTQLTSSGNPNQPLPNVNAFGGNAGLLVYWDDLHETTGNVYHQTIGSTPNRTFIVQWDDLEQFDLADGTLDGDEVTFEVQIFESPVGGVVAQYLYADTNFLNAAFNDGASATVGFQRSATSAIQWSFNTAGAVTPSVVLSLLKGDLNGNGIPDGCEPPGEIVWDPSTNPTPWPNNNPDATTRSLRFKVTSAATGTPPVDAIKVTMINLQDPVPPNLPQNPPPDFSGYESGTCAPRTCVGGSRNGLTCTVPTDCPSPGVCTAAVESNGCARWVGKPGTFLESQDIPLGASNRAARLQCTPFYTDWVTETAGGPIAVVGAEIAPSSEYSVQTFGASCTGAEAACTNVSTAVPMFTRRSGDVEVPFVPPGASGQPNVTDIAQLVNKFKNVAGAPVKAVAQLQPNLPELNADINALDIVAVVDAVKEKAYAFSGPCACPATVPCGMTSCASVTPCVNAFGVGATCVKTCTGGDNAGDPCINDTHCPGGTCGAGFCRDRCGRCTPP